jgi:hypothetical protein
VREGDAVEAKAAETPENLPEEVVDEKEPTPSSSAQEQV